MAPQRPRPIYGQQPPVNVWDQPGASAGAARNSWATNSPWQESYNAAPYDPYAAQKQDGYVGHYSSNSYYQQEPSRPYDYSRQDYQSNNYSSAGYAPSAPVFDRDFASRRYGAMDYQVGYRPQPMFPPSNRKLNNRLSSVGQRIANATTHKGVARSGAIQKRPTNQVSKAGKIVQSGQLKKPLKKDESKKPPQQQKKVEPKKDGEEQASQVYKIKEEPKEYLEATRKLTLSRRRQARFKLIRCFTLNGIRLQTFVEQSGTFNMRSESRMKLRFSNFFPDYFEQTKSGKDLDDLTYSCVIDLLLKFHDFGILAKEIIYNCYQRKGSYVPELFSLGKIVIGVLVEEVNKANIDVEFKEGRSPGTEEQRSLLDGAIKAAAERIAKKDYPDPKREAQKLKDTGKDEDAEAMEEDGGKPTTDEVSASKSDEVTDPPTAQKDAAEPKEKTDSEDSQKNDSEQLDLTDEA